MNIPTLPHHTKTFLRFISFTVALLATTLLPIFSDLPPAAALTDTYPISIAGCRYASGSPSGYYTCDLKDSAKDLYFDPWSEYSRECTSYVAWMLHSVNGFEMPFNAEAMYWGTMAAGAPYNYTVNMTPAVGSVYWNSSIDHVGWVQSVSTDGTQVTYQDYNFDLAGNYGDRTVATSSASGYIHFKDLSTTGLQMMLDTSGDVWAKSTGNQGTSGWNGEATGGEAQVVADGTDGIQLMRDTSGNVWAKSSTNLSSGGWTEEVSGGIASIAAGRTDGAGLAE